MKTCRRKSTACGCAGNERASLLVNAESGLALAAPCELDASGCK
jgi:hypothetical protein